MELTADALIPPSATAPGVSAPGGIIAAADGRPARLQQRGLRHRLSVRRRHAAIQKQRLSLRPNVVHMSGIFGIRWSERRFVAALARRLEADYTHLDWVGQRGWHEALTHIHDNRLISHQVAAKLVAIKAADPSRPLLVTCHSGGAGMLAFALEVMVSSAGNATDGAPPRPVLDGVVMIAPALSPQYDLSRALARVGGTCLTLFSRHDGLALGPGTSLFGTIDRRHVHAAGRVGFQRPAGACSLAYAKLVEVPYTAAWLRRFGHAGGHAGGMGRRFATGYVAPLLAEMAARSIDAGHCVPASEPVSTVSDCQVG